jgi:hypothetical protein
LFCFGVIPGTVIAMEATIMIYVLITVVDAQSTTVLNKSRHMVLNVKVTPL